MFINFSSIDINSPLFIQTLLFGYNSEDYMSERQVDRPIAAQTTTLYIRNKTNSLVLHEFYENPLIGIGSENIKNIKVHGYYTHSYPIFLMGSYGIFGIIILICQILSFIPLLDIKFIFYFSILIFPLLMIVGEIYIAIPFFLSLMFFNNEYYYSFTSKRKNCSYVLSKK